MMGKAAQQHLIVDFHGTHKPTGLRRTYPNLLNREGVIGMEFSRVTDRDDPVHQVTIPFTRMLAGPAVPRDPAQAIWKPHPKQEGSTWWQADLGGKQKLDSVRVDWVKPGDVKIRVEVAGDGATWSLWASGRSRPDEDDTTLHAPRVDAQFVKLTFNPAQFEGTRKIEIRLRDSLGRLTLWQPSVRKTWYEELRNYTPDGFQLVSYNDSAWNRIQVPGYWEAQGHGKPDWFQPSDEVGCYRRTFTVPDAWRGRHLRLRCEGANNGAQVWVNGQEVGYHEGGFTPFEFDVTPLVKFGAENLIAVRVTKLTLTSEYETDDAFFFRFDGRQGASPVIFGEVGDSTLPGTVTLEALGLILDPLKRELRSLPMLLALQEPHGFGSDAVDGLLLLPKIRWG